MAKILKVGYMPVPEYDLVCEHCGTMARYQKRELRFFEDCYDTPCVSFTCPHCDKETTIIETRLPSPCAQREIGEIKDEKRRNYISRLKIFSNWWGG